MTTDATKAGEGLMEKLGLCQDGFEAGLRRAVEEGRQMEEEFEAFFAHEGRRGTDEHHS
ncbi:MAG: hypothetical protein V3T08_09410 [Gemmatimonadota bacterium]